MINDTIDPFINAYRDSLDRQRDLAKQNLESQRRNQFQSIMAGANKVGMMYSNFPERAKIQFDTNTYEPAVAKVQTTYQTGLDKLRSNTVDLVNQLKTINEAIDDLNSTGGGGGTKYSTNLADYYSDTHGYQFRDKNGNLIRANTWARNNGYNTWDVVAEMARRGDANAIHALAGYNNANKQLTNEEVAAFNTLGISTEGYGHRD